MTSRKILEKVLTNLESTDDRGPRGEGWKSDELIAEINEIRKQLRLPERSSG